MPLNVDKDLPSLPGCAELGKQMRLQVPPSTRGMVNATRSRPTLNLEKHLSPEELVLLRDHWNEATSARHVRFERQPVQHGRRSTPIPTVEAENVSSSISRGNDHASTPVPKKRWGLFRRQKPVADASKLSAQAPKRSKSVRFLDKATAARSTPNLNAAANAGVQKASPVPLIPRDATITPAIKRPVDAPANQSGEVTPQELEIDLNDGGIYLTLDPEWRSSRGDVLLTFLSPIPDEIPDSPIIHRRHSLDELRSRQSMPMPQNQNQAIPTRPRMDSVGELHSFLCLED